MRSYRLVESSILRASCEDSHDYLPMSWLLCSDPVSPWLHHLALASMLQKLHTWMTKLPPCFGGLDLDLWKMCSSGCCSTRLRDWQTWRPERCSLPTRTVVMAKYNHLSMRDKYLRPTMSGDLRLISSLACPDQGLRYEFSWISSNAADYFSSRKS